MRVFISHAASDVKIAHRIRDVLVDQGFDVWDPEREILPGSNPLTETGRALEKADAVVFLLSDDEKSSWFAKHEFQYVMTRPKYESRVFPIQLGKRVGHVPWVLRDQVIHTSSTDPTTAAREVATRLQRTKETTTIARRRDSGKSSAVSSTPTKRRV